MSKETKSELVNSAPLGDVVAGEAPKASRPQSVPKPSLAKRESAQGVTTAEDFVMPKNPEINLQQQQVAAAKGSQEYAQGQATARAVVAGQASQFKQGYADELNDVMPAVGADVAEFVEGGKQSVTNFFGSIAAQVAGQ